MVNPGVTVPFLPEPLGRQREAFEELVDLGYSDAWTGESDGYDGFTALAMAAAWAPTLRVGTAIIPVFTRGPGTLAQCAAGLADAAPGRFLLGIGASSNVIVERWNDIPFERPLARTRDVLRFLRPALAGERVDETYDTFRVKGFRLSRPPEVVPPILLAALRPRMLALAGEEGDGAILNWLSADDVRRCAPIVHAGGAGKEIVARIFVCPSEDAAAVRAGARRMMAAYLTVGVYKEFHRWLGRDDVLGGMWERWDAGDRAGALEAIPDDVVDELVVHGSPAACRAHLQRYVDAGVTTPVAMVLPFAPIDPMQAVRDLAPRAGS